MTREAASTKPHLLRFCMVQCSQSSVRQHRACAAHTPGRASGSFGHYTVFARRMQTEKPVHGAIHALRRPFFFIFA
jgi:hypothetical protein